MGNRRTDSEGPAFCVQRRCGRHCLTEEACQWRPGARAKMLFQRDRRPGQIEIKIGQKEGEYSLTFTSSVRRIQPAAAAAPGLLDCCHGPLGGPSKVRLRRWRA